MGMGTTFSISTLFLKVTGLSRSLMQGWVTCHLHSLLTKERLGLRPVLHRRKPSGSLNCRQFEKASPLRENPERVKQNSGAGRTEGGKALSIQGACPPQAASESPTATCGCARSFPPPWEEGPEVRCPP